MLNPKENKGIEYRGRSQERQGTVSGGGAYFSDPAGVQQDALPLLHELEEVSAPHLH